MALQTPVLTKTFPVDAAIAANLIVIASGTNAGNVAKSGAKAQGFVGITKEASDTKGYVAVDMMGIAQITVGTDVTAGNLVASDANGKAAPITPAASSGATVGQVVGVALNTAAAGALVDVLLQPMLALQTA